MSCELCKGSGCENKCPVCNDDSNVSNESEWTYYDENENEVSSSGNWFVREDQNGKLEYKITWD